MPDGPLIPKYYATKTSDAPTPTAAKLEEGEIITCTKTGRMWTKCLGTVVPITTEFSFTNLLGETTAGIKRSLQGSAPFQSAQVNVYGDGGLKVNAGVSATTYSGTGLDINGAGQINIKTTLSAANPLHLMSSKPTMSNSGIATGSDCHWFSVTSTLGSEFGDLGGGGGAYRTNAVIDGSGLKVSAIPSKYMLSTDSSGRLQAATADFGTAALSSNWGPAVTNTDEQITGLTGTLSAGTWLVMVQISCTHSSTFNPAIALKNATAGTVLAVGQSMGSGSNNGCQVQITTVVTLASSSVLNVHHRSDANNSVLANPTNITNFTGGSNMLSYMKWVRLA